MTIAGDVKTVDAKMRTAIVEVEVEVEAKTVDVEVAAQEKAAAMVVPMAAETA